MIDSDQFSKLVIDCFSEGDHYKDILAKGELTFEEALVIVNAALVLHPSAVHMP